MGRCPGGDYIDERTVVSAFSGPAGKGAMKRRREDKRLDAEERNAVTPHWLTRRHRVVGCDCGPTPADRLLHAIFGDGSATG